MNRRVQSGLLLLVTLLVLSVAPVRADGSRSAAPIPMSVPGYRAAMVIPPAGGRRPVVVVLHGSGDSPNSICPAFDVLVHGRAWLLCTSGAPLAEDEHHWVYPNDSRRVAAEIRAALAALTAQHPAEVDASAPLLAGFSAGAMHAAFISGAHAASFPRAFIIDTHHVWSQEQLATYVHSGGRAVAFACSRTFVRDCNRLSRADGAVSGAPLTERIRHLADREHGYDAVLFERVRDDFDAILATDPRTR